MDSSTTLTLVLQGKYDGKGRLKSHVTARRVVAVDLESVRKDIRRFRSPNGIEHYGLKGKTGYWMIMEAFELMEPEVELHEDKYPVGYSLTDREFSELLAK